MHNHRKENFQIRDMIYISQSCRKGQLIYGYIIKLVKFMNAYEKRK